MEIQHKIIDTLPVFETTEPLAKAIDFFEDTTHSHLAITEDGKYVGCLSENDLASMQPEEPIDSFRFDFEGIYVRPEISWLDLLEKFARNDANLIPVVNAQNEILGYYSLNDIVDSFIGTPFFTEPGGILVVEKEFVIIP